MRLKTLLQNAPLLWQSLKRSQAYQTFKTCSTVGFNLFFVGCWTIIIEHCPDGQYTILYEHRCPHRQYTNNAGRRLPYNLIEAFSCHCPSIWLAVL